jgi:hypothetical protein
VREALPQLMLLPVEKAVRRLVELTIASHRVETELHRVFFEQLPRVGDFTKVEASLNEGMIMAEAYLRAHTSEVGPQNHALSAFLLVHTVETLTHVAVVSRPDLLVSPEFLEQLTALVAGYLQRGSDLKPTARGGERKRLKAHDG